MERHDLALSSTSQNLHSISHLSQLNVMEKKNKPVHSVLFLICNQYDTGVLGTFSSEASKDTTLVAILTKFSLFSVSLLGQYRSADA